MANGGPTARSRLATDSRWAEHRPAIQRLYISERQTLKRVMEVMKRDHGFSAT